MPTVTPLPLTSAIPGTPTAQSVKPSAPPSMEFANLLVALPEEQAFVVQAEQSVQERPPSRADIVFASFKDADNPSDLRNLADDFLNLADQTASEKLSEMIDVGRKALNPLVFQISLTQDVFSAMNRAQTFFEKRATSDASGHFASLSAEAKTITKELEAQLDALTLELEEQQKREAAQQAILAQRKLLIR